MVEKHVSTINFFFSTAFIASTDLDTMYLHLFIFIFFDTVWFILASASVDCPFLSFKLWFLIWQIPFLLYVEYCAYHIWTSWSYLNLFTRQSPCLDLAGKFCPTFCVCVCVGSSFNDNLVIESSFQCYFGLFLSFDCPSFPLDPCWCHLWGWVPLSRPPWAFHCYEIGRLRYWFPRIESISLVVSHHFWRCFWEKEAPVWTTLC